MSKTDYAQQKLQSVKQRISTAEHAAARQAGSVRLIGASKKQIPELVRAFHQAGLRDVGENYLQEALNKRAVLEDTELTWHFIGQIQSNKTKPIAENFRWVHGVDRLKIAQRLGQQNPRKEPINILLQLNLDDEGSKGGVSERDVLVLADQVSQLEGVSLRGFMLIPKARETEAEQRAVFAKASRILEQCNQRYRLALDQLSMGMSGDLEAAIQEGSTMVRIGTDLFGARAV